MYSDFVYICIRRIAGSHEPSEKVSKQPCRRFKICLHELFKCLRYVTQNRL